MRIILKSALFVFTACVFNGLFMMPYANAGELDAKMERMAKRMAKTVNEKYPGMENATMAVFPFSADDKLTKKKVDFAVTEILTRQFLKNSKLKLIERSQLEKILAEQKLGLSGAIDSETAAKVGKLLGARLALLGVVSRMGKSYQISAKIADNDTAEILAVEIEEISARVFDEEAAMYLALVPETQAIGLFIGFSEGTLQVINVSPLTVNGVTLTPLNPAQESYGLTTLGVKYYFFKNTWLAELNFTLMRVRFAQDQRAYGAVYGGISQGDRGTTFLDGTATKVTVLRRFNIHDRWSAFLGGGMAQTSFNTKNDIETVLIPVTVGASTVLQLQNVVLKEEQYQTPVLRAGFEFRPQSRFGIGVFGNYFMQKYENTIIQNLAEPSGSTMIIHKMEIFKFSAPQTYLELDLSLYF